MDDRPWLAWIGCTVRFGARVALDDFSLDAPPAAITAFVGPNGSGKSTALAAAAGTIPLTAGRVRIPKACAGGIGFVFQRPALDDRLTVRENLRLAGAVQGLTRRQTRAQTDMLCERLGVHDRLDDRVSTLSGGLARRADLARGLIHDPTILLLDEPEGGLDPAARAALKADLSDIASDRSRTVVLATHDLDLAAAAAAVAMLDRGRLIAHDHPDALRRRVGRRVVRTPRGVEPLETDDAANTRLADLVRAGEEFTIGPPTLADAFASLTGRQLTQPADTQPADTQTAGMSVHGTTAP